MNFALRSVASFFLTFGLFVHAQPDGFISINCGVAEDSTYNKDIRIWYNSDAGFIDTGINGNLPEGSIPAGLKKKLYMTVRSFPNGSRNCYRLKPVEKGNKYLVRAYFLYGNYDDKNSLPEFDLYLNVNLWKTISISNESTAFFTEIMTVATMEVMSICLVNKNLGTPFISALELRPLPSSIYIASNESQSLVLIDRFDLGSNCETRYPDDPFDLIWRPLESESWRHISTNLPMQTNNYKDFDRPEKVLNTAATPINESDPLGMVIKWSVDDPNLQIHVYRHFAELQQLEPNMTRELRICCNGDCYLYYRPVYLVTGTVYTTVPLSGQNNYTCWFSRTANSTLPPILNAFETYSVLKLSTTPTKTEDVKAMADIKAAYKVKRNWMGDPCLPIEYLWEGVTCNYTDSGLPTIISLNLSSTELNGEIAPSLANLTSIKSLDLSGNKLSGQIPDFLGDLPSLLLLNLTGNQLSGTIPSNLLERSNKGPLKLSIDNNPNLSVSDTSKQQFNSGGASRRKIIIPVAASIASILILLTLVIIILWTFKRRKRDTIAKSNRADSFTLNKIHKRDGSMRTENQRFTHAEVVRMTNNFEKTIGSGGFGTVYHGEMIDGTQVAVKMISLQSVKLPSHPCRGTVEFQNEVQLLMRVHHRNLLSFRGYSHEGDDMALIYEYMAKGNLASHLSGSNSNPVELSWAQRLRIALDVAQGLEYLHCGCKPPIIHRDMKTTDILLNERLEAKIGDFGLSKAFLKDDEVTHVSTAVKGTHGYLDPEYYTSNHLTEKSDVYSFGVVLLELITGQPAIIRISDNERTHIIEWTRPFVAGGNIQGIIDPQLEGYYNVNSVWKAVEVAFACTPPRSIERPDMNYVVGELRECLETEMASEKTRNMHVEQAELSSSFYPLPR